MGSSILNEKREESTFQLFILIPKYSPEVQGLVLNVNRKCYAEWEMKRQNLAFKEGSEGNKFTSRSRVMNIFALFCEVDGLFQKEV